MNMCVGVRVRMCLGVCNEECVSECMSYVYYTSIHMHLRVSYDVCECVCAIVSNTHVYMYVNDMIMHMLYFS
jgi:hypothetical protein